MKPPPPPLQRVSTLADVLALPGNPVPVSIYARMSRRNRQTVYDRVRRRTLPACYLCGLLCVVVPPAPTKTSANPEA